MLFFHVLAVIIPFIDTISAATTEPEGIRIPISRRDTIVKKDGSIDALALRVEIAHVQTSVRSAF